MTEWDWLKSDDPTEMLEYLKEGPYRVRFWRFSRRPKCERKLRLFLVACIRRIWPLLLDHRSRRAVEVAERFADGLAKKAELEAAHHAANVARIEINPSPNSTAFWAASSVIFVAQAHSRYGFPSCGSGAREAAGAIGELKWIDETQGNLDLEGIILEECAQAEFLRDVFGNPFEPVAFKPTWLTSIVIGLAKDIYESRTFDRLPILADALQDAGCDNIHVMNHCRQGGPHVRGCWLVDSILGKSG